MLKKNIFILFLFVFTIFIFAGCANVDNNSQTENGISRPTQTTVSSTNVVGENGGEINASDKIKLNIPQGALNKDTNIEITYNPNTIDKSLNSLGEIEFGPSGTKFDKPVEVKMKLNKETLNNELSVFYYDKSNNKWEYVSEGNIKDGYVTFNINHFSKYQVVDITPEMLNRYVTIVKQAKTNNKNDAWITATYYDYLKNELHLLDYYQKYDGLYYEACGLFISGSYQIDGNSGDSNELIKRYGESNKVGDTYGLSKIAGETVSYDEYKNNKENKELIDISITIDYKMIKPNITLSATKTSLNVGESATVNVYTHYVNNNNYFYKDFELPYYNLSITKDGNNLSLDKNKLVTGENGKGSFNVTCMDDKKETVTVTFNVSGDFGTNSSSSITFNDEGDYEISGHVVEELKIEYYVPVPSTSFTKVSNGTFNVKIEYSIEGYLNSNGNNYSGEINIVNASAEASSNKNLFNMTKASGTAYYNFVNKVNSITPYNQTLKVTGSYDNDKFIINSSDIKNIIIISVTGESNSTIEGMSFTEPSTTKITVNNKSNLLEFTLVEGTNSYNYSKINDDFKYESNYMDQIGFDFDCWNITEVSHIESTTQTITITKK